MHCGARNGLTSRTAVRAAEASYPVSWAHKKRTEVESPVRGAQVGYEEAEGTRELSAVGRRALVGHHAL